jgi:hypothetical protein
MPPELRPVRNVRAQRLAKAFSEGRVVEAGDEGVGVGSRRAVTGEDRRTADVDRQRHRQRRNLGAEVGA